MNCLRKELVFFLFSAILALGSTEPGTIRWCVLTAAELQKCLDFAGNATENNIHNGLQCIRTSSALDCMEKIKEGKADAVTLDGGDIYSAGRCYGLVPAAGECYKNNESLIYYAVAVANKLQDISMETLSNMSSCHSGMKRTAGWVVPVGFLVNRNIITVRNCDFAGAIGSLFKQSCIPGIKDLQYDPLGTNPQNLCEGCGGAGDGQSVCANSSFERYFGYAGAFRCLAENKGDVAFVRHSTVFENSDGTNSAPWARDLKAADFKLLCEDGSTAPVWQYTTCNLAAVPAHAVMTQASRRHQVFRFLDNAQKRFGDNAGGFQMFKSSDYGDKDLLFNDATTRLVAVQQSYSSWLGQSFLTALQAFDCEGPCYLEQ
ncbi:otolith matrix protein 1-like [Acipenser oxyrinchus oxyrinchus]|uniref:Otolith matrix protein 1-like n=1 Tax=Acipenser oxyrinchus oxyrinchus TaxID=40147 RepID=A0AAD8DGM4_ACIOX|nr:otolith matrix protein 1-like [Acipenser oxyrinchus oxyrinchus]